ncbi:tRNA dihydrouridine synthase [Reinekea thalattae]|uniref:tRNA-dihydrouridine(16) synthase n=1 Tax=Reinekea thalattae TaxID=2593301 RepID=A0A5C8ZA53_9GAMM|nr:tRNA-dihydrouridine synthase [Reinekea thalattae]TXR54048.1 tRNA dihydrouridine(16) synthase DusC [Reinekea thalattae]
MKIYLAPMEGLADQYLRHLIAKAGGYDLVVTEFVRVVDQLLPASVFHRTVPELLRGSVCGEQTPLRVQLLGNHPEALARNAVRAIELGSHGVDLNFGCPSKTVNGSQGGAVLLQQPEQLYRITRNVRQAVDQNQPVSAKMRLGYEDHRLMKECALALEAAGANEITVHARTKVQGYTPPAHWHLVAEITSQLNIPTIINGEIWNSQDAEQALLQSGCQHLMLGRGAVRNPWLAQQITTETAKTCWSQLLPLVDEFWQMVRQDMSPRYCAGRLKQWLSHLRLSYPEAEQLYNEIKRIKEIETISAILARQSAS